MVLFQPGHELVEARQGLRDLVETCLTGLRSGHLPTDLEREHLDLKEEAGRRSSSGALLAGSTQSTAAADHLADEVSCMSNTPGGGVLILGVEDRTGHLLGTALDVDWLRHRINQLIDVAPLVEERIERGIRLLLIFVVEAREPVLGSRRKLVWRVGGHCAPVDRAEWWLARQQRTGADPMAGMSARTMTEVSDGALVAARRFIESASPGDTLATAPPAEMLRRLGALRADGHLSHAGALVFCSTARTLLTWTRIDVLGGDVLAAPTDLGGMSLLEQVAHTESRLEAGNDRLTLTGRFAERRVRRLPQRAAREAILNGVIHRDWDHTEPTTITWVEADSSLEVISPGGFTGGVTSETVLTLRHARHPALADLFRALGLVDKEGIGVDRMFREMVVLGHRRPVIIEEAGPRVRTRLAGGTPVAAVMRLIAAIEPAIRQDDVRVALTVHALLHAPFITAAKLRHVLQCTLEEAEEAIEVTEQCVVDEHSLLEQVRDVWVLSRTAVNIALRSDEGSALLTHRGILRYLTPDASQGLAIVRQWLESHDRITSGDYAALAHLSPKGARQSLERLERDGRLLRGETLGRNAHFLAGPSLTTN